MTARRKKIRALDLFAGAGGSSLGAQKAGVHVRAAVDTWSLARKTYLDNFSETRFFKHKCETLDPQRVLKEVGPIDLLLASPDCTNHTCAKGNSPRSEASRNTAFQVVRFARVLRPRWIVIENVVHMRSWKKYNRLLDALRALGYLIREQVLNAADYGVPQSRKRLFIVGDMKVEPRMVRLLRRGPRLPATRIVDTNGGYTYSRLRTPNRAAATLQRAERAIRKLGGRKSFLLVYYGTDGAGGWQRLTKPLRTITTVDRFAFVRPGKNGRYEMRMLQVPELQQAMGFPLKYELNHGTRRDRIKLLGNAVCPPLMTAVVESLTTDGR